jgi:hypothetical protein
MNERSYEWPLRADWKVRLIKRRSIYSNFETEEGQLLERIGKRGNVGHTSRCTLIRGIYLRYE